MVRVPLACYVAHPAHGGGVATEVAGTFRVSGSNKRMRELQAAFETPPTVRIMLGTHRSGVLTEPLVWQTPQMGERELYDTRCRECVPTIPHSDACKCLHLISVSRHPYSHQTGIRDTP